MRPPQDVSRQEHEKRDVEGVDHADKPRRSQGGESQVARDDQADRHATQGVDIAPTLRHSAFQAGSPALA
jgi:hypothetical protein